MSVLTYIAMGVFGAATAAALLYGLMALWAWYVHR